MGKRRGEDVGGVGKYLKVAGGGVGAGQGKTVAVEDVLDYGVEKKKKKAGGFGDFSGW